MSRVWCKQCEIFIDDNNISKQNHNDSQKHLRNLQKSIQKLHQKNRDEAREKGIKPDYLKKKKAEPKVTQVVEKTEVHVGGWETVELREPVIEPIIELSKEEVRKEATKAISVKPKHSEHDKEIRKWNLSTKKQIELTLSDSDEESKPSTKFKKRKIIKK